MPKCVRSKTLSRLKVMVFDGEGGGGLVVGGERGRNYYETPSIVSEKTAA